MTPDVSIGTMDVTRGFDTATERTKRLLFPFDLNVWFAVGVTVLAESCAGPPSFNLQIPGGNFGGGGSGVEAQNAIAELLGNPIVIALIIAGLGVGLVLAVVGQWLGSRGTMMFIRSVATLDTGLGDNWNAAEKPATSLFWFQLAMMAIGLVPLLFGLGAVAISSQMFTNFDGPVMAVIVLAGLAFLVVALVLSVVGSFTRNIVAPLMWRFDLSAVDGWKLLQRIAAQGNTGQLALFLLLRVVIGFAMGIVTMIVGLVTCCIGLLPLVNQILFAPLHVWERSFGLAAVESLGPDFSMFTATAPPEPPKDPMANIEDADAGFPGDPGTTV